MRFKGAGWHIGRRTAVIAPAALVLVVRLVLLAWLGKPVPIVPDEFSYLLLGDTFAGGRAVNPAHPMWRHFETLFVLNQPVYASVYPPVQGLFLALGGLMGDPWIGVLLSTALMCTAIAWMLLAWLPPRWALYGAMLAGAQLGLLSCWMNSYWGGAPAALGGALSMGAALRLQRRSSRRDALLFALGLLTLANSRPYEGLAFAAPVAVAAGWKWLRTRAAFAFALVALYGGAATLWYWHRVSGDFLRPPYQAYMEQYAFAPVFWWQAPRQPPPFRDAVLRDAHRSFLVDFERYRRNWRVAIESGRKIAGIVQFYLGPLLLIPLLAARGLIRNRTTRLLLVSMAACTGAILLVTPFQPHYAAPMTCALFGLVVHAVRSVYAGWRDRNAFGRVLAIAAPLACLWMSAAAFRPPRHTAAFNRSSIEIRLRQSGVTHLVIVQYGGRHLLGNEWVYNAANLDRSAIVWARDLGEENAALMRYYPERRVWLLRPDDDPIGLILIR